MTDQNKIWQLMARNLSGEANEEEISLFNHLLSQNPELQQQYDLMLSLWQIPSVDLSNTLINEKEITSRLIVSTEDENLVLFEKQVKRIQKRKMTTWLAVACMAGLVILFINLFDVFSQPTIPTAKVIEAPNGSIIKSQLPDGSVVFLNAGSVLTYDQFSDSLREVTIIGEGYFDIVPDKQRPFIVHADNIDIHVLGTRFTVKSYPGDELVETTLLHGEIELKKSGGLAPIRMKPNQKFSVVKLPLPEKDENSGSYYNAMNVLEKDYHISTIDSALKNTELSETSWIYNRFIFRGDKFDQLARKMERWFDVKIVFTDDEVKSLSFHGSFENETIEQALKALQLAKPFKYKIVNHEISIGKP